ncbi:MAG: DUF4918 family protein [Paludibacter sp.]|nr:DUF4918 family protein [Paludibacter sp.]
METLADKIIAFNRTLDFKGILPEGIRIMNPFREREETPEISATFYRKYYNDHNPRHLILGINPGRFGAGLTGIPFTDPKHLTLQCGISYNGPMAHEPSSVFVYDMIRAFGGEEAFYSRFYISAVCPLGFTSLSANTSKNQSTNHTKNLSKNLSSYEVHESVFPSNQTLKGTAYDLKFKEVNYNYYDSRELTAAVYDFMVESLQTQLGFGVERDVCFCLGTGKNEKFLNELNARYGFFKKIVSLEHPRYIMQYKAKTKEAYIEKYIQAFQGV